MLHADGLRALAGIRAVCKSPGVDRRLQGLYVDEQGHRTVMSFEPVASSAGARPRFVVTAIVRYFMATDPVHLKAVAKEVAERYRGLPSYATATEPAAAWIPIAAHGPHLRLLAPAGDGMRTCAGTRSVKSSARTRPCRATCRKRLAPTALANEPWRFKR